MARTVARGPAPSWYHGHSLLGRSAEAGSVRE